MIVTLSCTSGFAMQWLMPRLADFEVREPEVDVRINSTNRLVNLLLDGMMSTAPTGPYGCARPARQVPTPPAARCLSIPMARSKRPWRGAA
ncbi:LysR substrate-binding domain-containing protein [Pseudoduganella violacea]|uniref:DNA-binding transcriptional LysR family regulator n=1 Tax=Pseudoduganella violacea TaxID=1715466 RepID=A0A7W5FW73_9BURK|nr:LysR substrate-binding domain-containing protein [Pseudoduganella violacea]MBB3121536.1 DNA-binding transcriptional LysR family regulator [Pseudoduganella violacea]